MTRKNPDTGELMKVILFGVGAYFVWEYVIAPMMTTTTAVAPGTAVATPAGTNVILTQPTSAPVTQPGTVGTGTATAPAPASALASQLTAAAQAAGLNPANVTADQWSYFYQNTLGRATISPTIYMAMMGSIGATGPSVISANQFVSALSSQGLSGITTIPPSMTFGGSNRFAGFRAPTSQKWVN